MTTPIDAHRTGKAAKILTAAEELILKQGFKGVTMSALAQRAHVGKGTPYLYWRTKEDLFLELIIGNLADALSGIAEKVRAAPDLALADQLCPTIADAWLERPLVRAVQFADVDVLGALVDDPRAHALVLENGAPALIKALLPIWRETGMIRTDWSVDEQADALEVVLVGYFVTRTRTLGRTRNTQGLETLRRAVAALLLTDDAPVAGAEVAEAVCAVLEAHAQRLRALIV